MSATLYVVRHGETTWNEEGRYQGRREALLSTLGIAQAQALAACFTSLGAGGRRVPSRVVSSPLIRCTSTAQFAAASLRLPIETDGRLIEIAHGTWEGRYRAELAANDPQRYRAWRFDPEHVSFEHGESLHDVRSRWRSFAASASAQDTLIVTHDALCRIALLDAMHRPLDDFWKVRVENGAFSRLAVRGGRFEVLEECHVAHLGALRAALEQQAL